VKGRCDPFPSKGDVPVHAAVAVKVHDHVDVNHYLAQ
jgi:hypothetical protein